jgi:hypothetical protein
MLKGRWGIGVEEDRRLRRLDEQDEKKRERIRMERKKRRVGWFLLLVNDQD